MKTVLMIMSIITGLLLFSTTVCGMWISRQNLGPEDYASSIGFHANIAYATALSGIVLVILVIVNLKRMA
ncbi:MAG: hypothetical protein ACM3TR_18870 [Caulobacteraceae bacterium]